MDTFIPPGYVAVPEIIQRTGQALFKDDWTVSAFDDADRALQLEIETLRRRWKAANTRRDMPAPPMPMPPEISARLAARKGERWIRDSRVEHVVAALRAALCVGAIASVVKLQTGQLVAVPSYVWQGDGAGAAFLLGTMAIGRLTGQVLFVHSDVEAWLAKQGRAAPQARKPAGAAAGKRCKEAVIAAAVDHFYAEGYNNPEDPLPEVACWVHHDASQREVGGITYRTAKVWAREVLDRAG